MLDHKVLMLPTYDAHRMSPTASLFAALLTGPPFCCMYPIMFPITSAKTVSPCAACTWPSMPLTGSYHNQFACMDRHVNETLTQEALAPLQPPGSVQRTLAFRTCISASSGRARNASSQKLSACDQLLLRASSTPCAWMNVPAQVNLSLIACACVTNGLGVSQLGAGVCNICGGFGTCMKRQIAGY